MRIGNHAEGGWGHGMNSIIGSSGDRSAYPLSNILLSLIPCLLDPYLATLYN